MIPNFNSYNILNESVILKKLEKGNSRNLSYGEMKKGFASKGYEFLGNISFKVKTINVVAYDEILNVVPDEICDKLAESGPRNYVSYSTDKRDIDTSLFGEFDENKLFSVLAEPNIEKVASCFTKKGNLYYVLWSVENKYFYFIPVDEKTYCNPNEAIGFLELFIKIRTSGIEEVTKEVDDVYAQYLDEKNAREEEMRIRKEEEEAKKAKEAEYQKRVDAIQADAEANPENYEEVEKKNLPQEILDAIDSDDYMDTPYAVYKKHISTDPYDRETVMCYVNDDDFTKGYKYKSFINHARPGTYWGD